MTPYVTVHHKGAENNNTITSSRYRSEIWQADFWTVCKRRYELYLVQYMYTVFQEKMQSSVGKSLLVFWLIRRCYCASDREPITHLV